MKLCILISSEDESETPLKGLDDPPDPSLFIGGHDYETHPLHKRTAVAQVVSLARRGFDCFINLCDGAWEEDRAGIEVVQALERLGVPFTGADSRFYEPSRNQQRRICYAEGIRVPAWVSARCRADIDLALRRLRFPMIVKHWASYSSIGLTKACRVTDADALYEQAHRMIERFGGAEIEEFVEGRELTVLTVENPDDPANPLAYWPNEIVFPPGEDFKHFDLKWKSCADMASRPCEDLDLARLAMDATCRLFVGLGGVGYARADLRVDREGQVHMLEINPNCSVFLRPEASGSADLILAADPGGHPGFLDNLIRAAMQRHRRQQPPWRVQFGDHGGYGIYAARRIEAGETIFADEGQPHYLVTRGHVERCWGERERGWFAEYAWPISDEVYVTWSPDPEDWRPVNHSCDPNAWLDGLDTIARRRIELGEEITMDYATFCDEQMKPFDCTCGSTDCRRVIRGGVDRAPFLDRYEGHVSSHIGFRRKR